MKKLENLFVPIKLAKLAHKHKFDYECFTYYNLDEELQLSTKEDGDDAKYPGDDKFDRICNYFRGSLSNLQEDELCAAPTYQQLMDWFREKKKLQVTMMCATSPRNKFICTLEPLNGTQTKNIILNERLEYYEVLNEALIQAFKMIENEK